MASIAAAGGATKSAPAKHFTTTRQLGANLEGRALRAVRPFSNNPLSNIDFSPAHDLIINGDLRQNTDWDVILTDGNRPRTQEDSEALVDALRDVQDKLTGTSKQNFKQQLEGILSTDDLSTKVELLATLAAKVIATRAKNALTADIQAKLVQIEEQKTNDAFNPQGPEEQRLLAAEAKLNQANAIRSDEIGNFFQDVNALGAALDAALGENSLEETITSITN
ncbi:hypothetical protein DID75_03680 [Candidatus Marinamargulisbacteria bacterium SCGC AG-410-N11]|nr:hypothetical protein DID75_03680 [Candidatus Marinamargulisbacteria bacterium SCGC AG-410-N11]